MDLRILEESLDLSFRLVKLNCFAKQQALTQLFKLLIKLMTNLISHQKYFMIYSLRVTKITIQLIDLLRGIFNYENLIE
jgi:hypothetical protein